VAIDPAVPASDGEPVAREHHLTVRRSARYVVIGEPSPAVRSVWVALHGYGQLAARFARHCRPLAAPDRLVVVPEALSRFYVEAASGGSHAHARVGATWMTREDRLAEISDYVAYLDRLVARVAEELPTMPPLHLLGFSQGAATAGRWALFGAPRVASLTLWGGGLPDDLDLAALRERLDGAPVTLVVGDADGLRPAERVAAQAAQLDAAGIDARMVTYAGGHHLVPDVLRTLAGG
jgi:predicted esterase